MIHNIQRTGCFFQYKEIINTGSHIEFEELK